MKPFWEISAGGGRAPAWRPPPGARPSPSTSAAAASPRTSSPRAACRSPCPGSTWSRDWARCCRSPKAGPSSCPAKVHDTLDQRTNPTWPTTWFAPRLTGDGRVQGRLFGHERLGRQPRRDQLRPHRRRPASALASILRIPVCMHNVDHSQLFRPSYWNAAGMDSEGSDYRACSVLGPLYGKKY